MRYNIHNCHVSNNNAVFEWFRCSISNNFFRRTLNLKRPSIPCRERGENVCSRNVYQSWKFESLFLTGWTLFGIKSRSEQLLYKKLAICNFESNSVPKEALKDTNTTDWIRKMSQFLWPFLQTLWKNLFSIETLILINLFHPLLELLKIYLPGASYNWKNCSLISRQRWSLNGTVCWRNSLNVTVDLASQTGWLWQRTLCPYSVPRGTKYAINWSAVALGTILQCETYVLFQQCKIWPQFKQILFAAHTN